MEVCFSKWTLEKIDEDVEVCCSTVILNKIEVGPFEVGVHVPLNYDCNKNQQKNKDLDLDKLGRLQRRKLMWKKFIIRAARKTDKSFGWQI